jgi:hypothetical protein
VVAIEAEFHILGGERVAVMKGDPPAQPELIRQTVFTRAPGLGQAGGLRIAGHGLHQGIVQGVEKQKRVPFTRPQK